MKARPEASEPIKPAGSLTRVTIISLLEDEYGLQPTVVAVRTLPSWEDAVDYERGLNRVLGRPGL